ncbi:hypothetical protein PM082_017758 [Marasmius tenuissimus]|nr:hypothetical protein PM082_017758 [Marasmius tenuissimus]
MSPPLTSATYFLSVGIGGMLYGVFITLAVMASVLDFRYRQTRPQETSTTSRGVLGPSASNQHRRGPRSYFIRLLRRSKMSFSRAMTSALMIVVTIHRGNLMYRGYIMFVTLGGGQAGQDFLTDSSHPSETVSNVTIALTSLIFDAAMCYRLWAFYANTWPIMVVPALTFTGQIVSAAVISVFLTRTSQGTSKPWYLITTYAALTLVTNIWCTGQLGRSIALL